MTTLAHSTTHYIADTWETYFASAVCSGIVGDAVHQTKNSYHNSLEDNPDQNGYSNSRPDDAAPPGTWPRNLAAAIDMSLSPTDMKLCSDRLWNAWYDKTDPRRNYVNAFNGWFNNNEPAKRYDYYSNEISETTSDHKWHVHLEIRRKYVEDMDAANAILSILVGETKQQYLDGSSVGGDDMFCKYGDKGEKVKALQNQLLSLDPNCLPKFGADGGYGDETAAALSRLVTGGEAKNYGGLEWAKMQTEVSRKYGPGSSTQIEWPLKAVINFPGTTINIPPTKIEADVVEQE